MRSLFPWQGQAALGVTVLLCLAGLHALVLAAVPGAIIPCTVVQ